MRNTLKKSVYRQITVMKYGNDADLERSAVEIIREIYGKKIIIYTPGHRHMANRIAIEVPDTDLFEIADFSKMIVDSLRRSRNLGHQLASEIFGEEASFRGISIFLVGYDKLMVYDFNGPNANFTREFIDAFLAMIDPSTNDNRLYFLSSRPDNAVDDIISVSMIMV
ncbi:hypothetical protein DMB44_07985 [Thermoplasma sp. Kam2015]|uniref:hypothetical protein n=1 Tax=Thermoplasma sp. Kam2015 TaxID=2094122 RepID=UPI000D860790|nr:hypothetical protein [Thermoplasma sp. Kam2015]PYB67657.1 hypothetical protein DMB44_07985 [Thermoplasma sp. Kam2015]